MTYISIMKEARHQAGHDGNGGSQREQDPWTKQVRIQIQAKKRNSGSISNVCILKLRIRPIEKIRIRILDSGAENMETFKRLRISSGFGSRQKNRFWIRIQLCSLQLRTWPFENADPNLVSGAENVETFQKVQNIVQIRIQPKKNKKGKMRIQIRT